ncbi:hypothetical protein GRO01_20450 [Gluconobacter roseus NBRC 3990]|uniref:Uncharacterized protein n=1 Tax=Gluconobacter roseus NBRC 3990 TaxID=1307950 RepID=A0A4Y3MDJ5_9PROT|nr:hypothetical protein AA3990_1861 [Gluconobacter roseus NBRC 3990]GEB04469.1 hypothetical protein GRO01_20450 [Gluconobacter roseus NBRC 3990]GLP92393.1 hypothetical protein GCM10007871_03710 [Gluconobacter roseus NBRC 3990]
MDGRRVPGVQFWLRTRVVTCWTIWVTRGVGEWGSVWIMGLTVPVVLAVQTRLIFP